MTTPERGVAQDGVARDDEDGGQIGIFPSWGWLYGSVIVYTLLLIVVLYVLSTALDFRAS